MEQARCHSDQRELVMILGALTAKLAFGLFVDGEVYGMGGYAAHR